MSDPRIKDTYIHTGNVYNMDVHVFADLYKFVHHAVNSALVYISHHSVYSSVDRPRRKRHSINFTYNYQSTCHYHHYDSFCHYCCVRCSCSLLHYHQHRHYQHHHYYHHRGGGHSYYYYNLHHHHHRIVIIMI